VVEFLHRDNFEKTKAIEALEAKLIETDKEWKRRMEEGDRKSEWRGEREDGEGRCGRRRTSFMCR
jgi:hypothetical protein